MKKILSLVFLFSFLINWSQTSNIQTLGSPTTTTSAQTQAVVAPILAVPSTPNSIWFDYDIHGNQIRRRQIFLASNRSANNNEFVPPDYIDEETKLEDVKFEESDIYSDVKYFPNPVVEILYVQWKNQSDLFVNNIQVFSFAGQLMGTMQLDRSSEQVEVDFRSYPAGMYELALVYSDANQKTLKIVKK